MVLLEVGLEATGQTQFVDIVVRDTTNNGRSAQLLQAKAEISVQGKGQLRLEEHHTEWILVVLQQSSHRCRRKNTRIVTVKTAKRKKSSFHGLLKIEIVC